MGVVVHRGGRRARARDGGARERMDGRTDGEVDRYMTRWVVFNVSFNVRCDIFFQSRASRERIEGVVSRRRRRVGLIA